MMDGLLIVDKPEGATSADVVRKVKRALQSKTGHLGTLDPFATGVLPICLGEATKVAQFLSIADKEYEGTIQLGRATDTGDVTGRTIEEKPVPTVDADELARVAQSFLGERQQIPPMYSALKKDGTPLYKLARQGVTIEREPRSIRITAMTLQPTATDCLAFRVSCSKGTYVRVLAEEISAALGTAGHVHTLRRTAFGRFRIDSAQPLADIIGATSPPPLIGLRESLAGLREFPLASGEDLRARNGDQALLLRCPPGDDEECAKLITAEGKLVAVIQWSQPHRWRYVRVFGN